ncbi:MAG: GDSL-type esterase/lipase family protein [Planctomycetota bacterium]|nr:GDSL-type esterase/lipase family protein [Planctomycetota bacterium]MDA0933093.1 GDSL-type esterase/lipase family protein [Planctomycetota bacterium]MDA1222094.1 GDSL-type esterase/lipase family protein [Planctomycetota bacterium]
MRARNVIPALLLLGSSAVVAYALGLPLTRPRAARGDYFFGHYGLEEIYVGVPALCAAGLFLIPFLGPSGSRALTAARVLLAWTVGCGALFAFDLGFALLFRGAIQPNHWLDFAHVSRADNIADPELGFRRKPHASWYGYVPEVGREVSYRVDANGFRNEEGLKRADLVFIGDSYTEAAQVDSSDTFVARVGVAQGMSVANLGRGAYGPQQELVVLRRHAAGYEPKVVVWQFFDGNDLVDAEQYARWRAGGADRPVTLLRRYLDNSFFRPWLEATRRPKRGDFARLVLDDGSEVPVTVRYRWKPNQLDERADGMAATGAALREGVAFCRERGIQVLVVVVPVMARVLGDRLRFDDPADAERYVPAESPDAGRDFATGLAAVCAELDVPCVDLAAAFSASAGADGIYIPRDEHLDLRGHEIAAEAIGAALDRFR